VLLQKPRRPKQKLLLKLKKKPLQLFKLLSEFNTNRQSASLWPLLKSGPQSAFFLYPNEIQVWYAKPEDFNNEVIQQKFRSWLSEAEIASLKALRFEHHRLTYLVAHALLRAALSSYTDVKPAAWQFQTNPFNKPFIAPPLNTLGLHFNLSHTEGMVALALTRIGALGVDVESISREQNVSEIAQDILTANEYLDLTQHAKTDQHTRLLKYWTLKEAFVKATGLGLTSGLQTFEFDLDVQPQPIIRFLSPKDTLAKNWHFKQCVLPSGHILALAHHQLEAPHTQVSLNEALWLQENAKLG
jgi:4'-phosphopantetheinyl transferase